MSDLTSSQHQRQNILNNRYALQAAEQHLGLGGVTFHDETVFTKQQVVALFDISEATVERYIAQHGDELKANGYHVLKGKSLKEFKDLMDATLINEGTKTSVLGVFSFRAVLNLAMLLTESERAKAIRSRLLDIVMDVRRAHRRPHQVHQPAGRPVSAGVVPGTELPEAVHRCAGPAHRREPVEVCALYQLGVSKHFQGKCCRVSKDTEASSQGQHPGDHVIGGADPDC